MNTPKNLQLLLSLFCISFLLSIPSLVLIPRYLPFLDVEVRNAAPKALEELQRDGLWLINTEMQNVERREGSICFTWKHQYRKRGGFADPETLTTCIDE